MIKNLLFFYNLYKLIHTVKINISLPLKFYNIKLKKMKQKINFKMLIVDGQKFI
jgi:hypothetical protein